MAIKSVTNLGFHAEYWDNPVHEDTPLKSFSVGLYRAPSLEKAVQSPYREKLLSRIRDMDNQAWCRRLTSLVGFMPEDERPTVLAAAHVVEQANILVVRNVAAVEGYGPTLYACLIEFARVRGLQGVRPTPDSKQILDRPKRIWRRFFEDGFYRKTIDTRDIPGEHAEPWLNKEYSLRDGAMLLPLQRLYENSQAYFNCAPGAMTRHVEYGMSSLLRKSVEAHRQR